MDIIAIVTSVCLALIFIGFLVGFLRSWKKSLVRFGILLGCLLIALFIAPLIVSKLMSKFVDGNTFSAFGITLDFEKDVKPLSQAELGGSVTERHLLYALAVKLENKFGRTNELIAFLEKDLNLGVNDKIKGYLLDTENENFLYDLLGVLKADTAFFYIDADEEMPDAVEFVKFAKSLGAIPAYA